MYGIGGKKAGKTMIATLHLPTSDLFIAIFSIESRFHLTIGVGLPDARQRSVTLDPSRTITSLELSESSILGGTVHHFICSNERKQEKVTEKRKELLLVKIHF